MGKLEFIISFIKAITWPTVVLIIIAIFKDPLKKLINDIYSIKGKTAAGEFEFLIKRKLREKDTKTVSKDFVREMLKDPDVKIAGKNSLYIPFKEALNNLEQEGFEIEGMPTMEEFQSMLDEEDTSEDNSIV